MLVEAMFLALVLIALFAKKRISIHTAFKPLSFTGIQILFGVAIIFAGAVALYFLIVYARLAPHGDYDAQAIWNLRARFIFRSGDAWKNAFSPLINRNFHMDYPLLIPLSVVGGWNTLGSEVLRVPDHAFHVISVRPGWSCLLCNSLFAYKLPSSHCHDDFACNPGLLIFSTFQTADIPLTYFFLASASLFVLASHENNRNLLFLSGIMAGLSAWTKNEGIPFVVLMVICTILISGIRQARVHLFSLLAGMALPLLTLVLFKTVVSVNNDLFTNNGLPEIISKLLTPTRYIQISTHLISEFIHLGNWPISIMAVLLVYGWIMGIRNPASLTEKVLWIIPLAQFAIYMLIYVITPHELEWHLNYSMSRLLIHLFPLALLSFFLFVNTPETGLLSRSVWRGPGPLCRESLPTAQTINCIPWQNKL